MEPILIGATAYQGGSGPDPEGFSMVKGMVQFPGAGCIVEFMQGNAPQIAWILEEQGGRLRLFLPNRRETTLQANRLLPWPGPTYPGTGSRDEMIRLMAEHRQARETARADIDVAELWAMAAGEVDKAPAVWFAELAVSEPGIDVVAAYGHALLDCKTHFKFQPPNFEVFAASMVENRILEQEAARVREELARQGNAWLTALWDAWNKKKPVPSGSRLTPETEEKIQSLLLRRIADPESDDDDAQWRLLAKGLPDDPFMPLYLAQSWGIVPKHYNFWMDRADYAPGDGWSKEYEEAITGLETSAREAELPVLDTPFVSIDSATTRDIDDAFFVEQIGDGGWKVSIALACPALEWPFESQLDKAVFHRATSIYLPEATHHMLPERLGLDAYSLVAGKARPALVLDCHVDAQGMISGFAPSLARVTVRHNVSYEDAESLVSGAGGALAALAPGLTRALELAETRQRCRIGRGAVIIDRPDPHFDIVHEEGEMRVVLHDAPTIPKAQLVVSELMILANAGLACWAAEHGIALLHRTQDVAVPAGYAGIWSEPQDIARVVKVLAPACLETSCRPHAGLGETAYAPSTSPLRRYPDLLNEAQILSVLRHAKPRWSKEELDAMLALLNTRLEAAGQVQRFRPRYWKLLYVKQQGDKHWWPAVVTDENDAFASISLPREQLFLRARRALMGERSQIGQAVEVRLNKVHPLQNEIHIAEVREPETL